MGLAKGMDADKGVSNGLAKYPADGRSAQAWLNRDNGWKRTRASNSVAQGCDYNYEKLRLAVFKGLLGRTLET